MRYSDSDFQRILYANEGYKYLLQRNNGTHIHYLLWDNFTPYDDQYDTLVSKIDKAEFYNSDRMEFLLDHTDEN